MPNAALARSRAQLIYDKGFKHDNRACWALFNDDREETKFTAIVNQRCALPRLETAQERAGRVLYNN
jgi:hypothetical protein